LTFRPHRSLNDLNHVQTAANRNPLPPKERRRHIILWKSLNHPAALGALKFSHSSVFYQGSAAAEIPFFTCLEELFCIFSSDFYLEAILGFDAFYLAACLFHHGDEIAREIARMKGGKPTPGTIYPALKQLRESGAVTSKKEGRKVIYSLTSKGQKGIREAIEYSARLRRDIRGI